jgi:phosphoglycolate phosphatase
VWFVGDTGVDIQCARNSGCVPVLLGGEMPEGELARCAPRLVLSDCPTLFRLIRGL